MLCIFHWMLSTTPDKNYGTGYLFALVMGSVMVGLGLGLGQIQVGFVRVAKRSGLPPSFGVSVSVTHH